MSKNNKPLHVAIVGTRGYPYVYGGYETFVKEMGERLVQRGIEVTIYIVMRHCLKNNQKR